MGSDTIALFAARVYTFLVPVEWVVLAVSILILGPMALFKKTRAWAGFGLFLASWIFALTTWCLGAVVTFATYGWVGFLTGLFIFGVGVVPIAIFAAFFSIDSPHLGLSLIVMSILVVLARAGGLALANTATDT